MIDLGVVRPGATIRIPFSSFDKDDGSAITMTNFAAADILVYKDGGTTERASTSGFTATTDFDSKTGKHVAIIDLSDNTTAGFWNAGSEYLVAIDSVTIDAVTTGGWIARFRIGYQGAMFDTTIASLSSQTSFTLTVGPAEDDALNGCSVIIHDIASAVQCGLGIISDYTGSTKTVTLAAGTTFTAAAGDNISVMFPMPLQPTAAGRTLDVSAGGEAGVDWANIGSPTTAQNLSGTNIDTDQVVASVAGAVGSVTGNVGGNVTGSVGSVASGGITAASFAADAITAAKIAADVTTELQSGLATASAVSTLQTTANAIDAKTTNLPSDPADQSLVIAATNAIAALLGTPAGASLSADVAAVKSDSAAILVDTAEIGAAGAGLTALGDTRLDHLDADVSSVGGGSLTVQDIVDGVFDEATAGHQTAGSFGKAITDAQSAGDPWASTFDGFTAGEILSLLAAKNLGKTIIVKQGSNRATVTFRAIDDSEDRIVGQMDHSERESVTLTP